MPFVFPDNWANRCNAAIVASVRSASSVSRIGYSESLAGRGPVTLGGCKTAQLVSPSTQPKTNARQSGRAVNLGLWSKFDIAKSSMESLTRRIIPSLGGVVDQR
jgi:hypothetical protein